VRRALGASLLCVLAPWPGLAVESEGAPDLAAFDREIARAVSEWRAPGLAIAVLADGRVVFERGYGVLDVEGVRAVDEHSLFAIGSTTKAMTVALVGMLADEGLLALDDRVIDHLPWFRVDDPYVTNELRVFELFTHTAGLPNTDYLWYEQDTPLAEIVRRLRFVAPTASMRSRFLYQNVMVATAGLLAEEVSGRSWGELLRSRLFEPLGMARTVPYHANTAGRDNLARPHDFVEGTLVAIENASVDNVGPAGSVWSSAHDMALWARFLLAGGVTADGRRLLSEASFAELFRPRVLVDEESFYPTARLTEPRWTTYSLGWFQADYAAHRVDFHTGSIDGMVAIVGLVREEGVGVIVLANRDHVELRHALLYRVIDLFTSSSAAPERDWSGELRALYDGLAVEGEAAVARSRATRVLETRPSLAPEGYVGRYVDELFGEVVVTANGARLDLRHGRRTATLEHWHYDTYLVPWHARWRGQVLTTFEVGPSGAIESLELEGRRYRRVAE
jgi:CubicO group peptidase (beta-lactamase class C family)